MPTFEELERLNALIDVWIDEEEYENVEEACNIYKTDLNKVFKNYKEKENWWLNLPSEPTIETVKIPPDNFIYSNKVNWDDWSECKLNDKDWAYLFWAKLIRAKIQQNGKDSYFDRLDELLVYLERKLPILNDKSDPEKIKISILYLLEMAATGLRADLRSFAERARRLLELVKPENSKEDKEAKDPPPFSVFYDLLARYNIGVSYFHEAEYRKAVLEFNLIIKKFDDAKKDNAEKNDKLFLEFAEGRFGRELLYLPAFMYRANVHLKLQLAYHAHMTIAPFLSHDTKVPTISKYKQATAEIIDAEALLQMGRIDKSLFALSIIPRFAIE